MLKERLSNINKILSELIELTKKDIEDIKSAKHELVEESVEEKTRLVKSFESSKLELDAALVELVSKNPNKDLSELLGEDEKESLSALRQNLLLLQKLNKEYTKSVHVVKEFYDSLLNTIFKSEKNGAGYGSEFKPETVLKVRI